MKGPIEVANGNLTPLTDDEINAFFEDIDKNKDGFVTFSELEAKLHQVYKELAPEPKRHHLIHPSRRDVEKDQDRTQDGLHAFLCQLLPDCSSRIDRADFKKRIQSLGIPSQKQTDTQTQKDEDHEVERRLPAGRRIRARLAVHGARYGFTALVITCILAIGLWQMIIYIRNGPARAALGWGVIVAKASAGALYPTLVFMLLSMSRHLGTWMRKWRGFSRVVNWDLSQAFHIKMSIAGLFFATLHAIAHLSGTFVFGSRDRVPETYTSLGPYRAYVVSLPGITGLTALGLFWIMSLLSMPPVRKWSYELFQAGHLLMFPFIGLLCAHGTLKLLQPPMLGYWLAFPALLVILERSRRVILGFRPISGEGKVLDNDTVRITCKHPRGKDWKYSAGQFLLLQAPEISRWQWHPFTISSCRGDTLHVHIKVDGDWTEQLRDHISSKGEDDNTLIKIGIDGPFGAPAQNFYSFDYSIIVGGGIGVTPFSAILTDIEESYQAQSNPWESRRTSRSMSRPESGRSSRAASKTRSRSRVAKPSKNPERRVDFHWIVREKNNLLWFSDLLNRAIEGSGPLAETGGLELNINTHITAKRKNISTHIFRYLLDSYRTEAAPYSALTGLKQPSHFGRPDFDRILDEHFQDMVDAGIREKRVGVFYCGPPVVGELLADKAHELTKRSRDMGLRITYQFLVEVFE